MSVPPQARMPVPPRTIGPFAIPLLVLPVQVPLPRLHDPEHPESPTAGVLDVVVVAGLVVPVPPDAGDPLRPGGPGEAMNVYSVGERQRRPVAVVRRAGRGPHLP